jgi:hypothetical protein
MAIDFLIRNGLLYRWREADKDLKRETVSGKFTLFGFRIIACPQLEDSVDAKGPLFKALLRQKSFLDSVGSILIRQFDGAVELRATKRPQSKIIDLALVFRVFTPDDPNGRLTRKLEPLNSVLSILPSDYEYAEAMSQNELAELLDLPAESRLIRVRKHLSWLPTGDVLSPQALNIVSPRLTSMEIGRAFKDGGVGVAVPAIDYLSWNENNWLTVWRIIQESPAEVGIALRISLASVEVFPFERLYANQALALILQTYGGYTKYDYEGYVRSLSKFVRPHSLYSSQILVACGYHHSAELRGRDAEYLSSLSDTTMNSVAHALCSEVSYGGVSRMTVFDVPRNEEKSVRLDWQLCRHTHPDELEEFQKVEWKESSEKIKPFLLRAPFIVDEIEAANLFRLPIAGVEGLPGIYTRPPKPFYQPNLPPPGQLETPGPLAETGVEQQAQQNEAPSTTSTVNLGQVIINHVPREYHTVKLDDLTRHALIVGATGSGKTNSTLNLLINLAQSQIPFLVIEPVKSEYFPLLSGSGDDKLRLAPGEQLPKVFTFNLVSPWETNGLRAGQCDRSFLRFNPLAVPPGITVAQHISFIKSCICAAFPMYGAMPIVLEIALRNLYLKRYGLFYRAMLGDQFWVWPKLSDLQRELEEYAKTVKHKEVREALEDQFLRRFTLLLGGVLGYALDPDKWFPDDGQSLDIEINIGEGPGEVDYRWPHEVILSYPTVIELEALADDDEKALVMAFLLTLLYEYRLAQGAHPQLRHLTIIEEAHRLLSSVNLSIRSNSSEGNQSDDSKTKAIQMFMNMLAEIRAYGEGIVIVEQIPTKLISDAIKNTNLKIMHRITSHEDREYLGEAMNFNEQQKRFVSSLRRGEAVVFEEHLDHPVLVRVDTRKN